MAETPLRNALLNQFKRREWTANRADPTQVIQWTHRSKRLVMTGSWGVEAKLKISRRFTWRTYDNRLFVWLFGLLENAHTEREMAYDEDPMGRPADYE